MFGEVDVHSLIEESFISVSVVNTNEELVASMALYKYPNIPSIPPSLWPQCIKQHYRLEDLAPRNTLFIHLLVWDTYYVNSAFMMLLEAPFLSYPYIQNIIMVVPPGAITSDVFDEHFVRIYPDYSAEDRSKVQSLYLCLRQTVVPKLNIRLAMEDDNDDLMAIFAHTDLLEKYGEYYFAELCNQNDDKSCIIVAEDNEHFAIGMMRLSSDVDTHLLNQNFNLEPFHGLHKQSYLDHSVLYEKLTKGKSSITKIVDVQDNFQHEITGNDEENVEEEITECRGCLRYQSIPTHSSVSSASESVEWIPPPPSHTDLRDPDPCLATVSVDEMQHLATDLNYSLHKQKYYEERSWLERRSDDLLDKTYKMTKCDDKIPTYAGEKNAFAIVLYGMSEKYDERRAHDFLASAFACFPNLDYCIITMPPETPVFPFLLNFVRAVPRPERSYQRELYIAHRVSILSDPKVREMERADLPAARRLAAGIGRGAALRALFRDPHLSGYLLLCEEIVVGVALIRKLEDVSDLTTRYDLLAACGGDAVQGKHALLRLLVVSPPFANWARFFLRELLRLSNSICFHHLLLPGRKPSVTALRELTPVLPRRLIKYWLPALRCGRPLPHLLRTAPPAALLVASRRLSGAHLDVNCRIVVVGASQAGRAFLERLVFRAAVARVRLCNLTLVSRDGLPGGGVGGAAKMLLPRRGRQTPRLTVQLGLHVWVDVVCGLMTDIHRQKKYIVVNSECSVCYDYLYLFCGRQFQKPEVHDRLSYVYKAEECHSVITCKKAPQGPIEYPDNVFVVNTEKEAIYSLMALRRLIGNQLKYNVVVYGHTLNAFCCLTALLEFGIPGTHITFVENFPDHMTGATNTVFNNPEIDKSVMKNLEHEGIRIYGGYFFHSWELSESEPKILKTVFISMTKVISLDCVALFYYPKKVICRTTYKALKRTSLPFDGGLLIDEHFRTSDPHVYAAGPVTRYSPRRCLLPLVHFCSEEVGERVADELLAKLQEDYNFDSCGPTTCELEEQGPAPWKQPMVVACRLPGGYHYLRVRRPGVDTPLEVMRTQHGSEDTIIVTGSCARPEGYFRLQFDSHNLVRRITCYSPNEIDVDNLICLYGKHESLLNNLLFRYEQGEIPDLFEYFRQPWCYALYHDRFQDLQEKNLRDISSSKGMPGETVIEEIGLYLKETGWNKMPEDKREELVSRFWASPLRPAVEERTLAFLRRHRDALPMYADPATFRPQ